MDNVDQMSLDVLNIEDKNVLLAIITLIYLMENVLLTDVNLIIKIEMVVLNVFLLIKNKEDLAEFLIA